MGNIKFFYDNLWDQYALTESTQHPHFPAEYTQHRDFNKPWRSRYGAGSGWGLFYIGPGFANNKLDFDEGGGAFVATITTGAYTTTTLCAEIKTRMEAAGAGTYTIEYIETGASANKFKITKSAGTLNLRWNTGANKANSIAGTIGFSDAADDTGSLNYTADYIRIHSSEYIKINLESAQAVRNCHIRGHNFQSTAVVKLQASSDNFTTVHWQQTFVTQDDIMSIQLAVPQTYQYWRIYITDVDNPDLYVEMGRVYLGNHFQPTRNFSPQRTDNPEDPSIINQSEGGQRTSIQETRFKTWDYFFMGTTEKADFDSFFEEVGKSKSFFFCVDPTYYLSQTYYVSFIGWNWEHIVQDCWNLRLQLEEER